MNRRNFLKLSSSLSLFPFVSCQSSGRQQAQEKHYDITFESDMHVGHLLFQGQHFPLKKTYKTQTLVVGGGIAGLSAACQFASQDFILCELSNRLGGSSGSQQYGQEKFTQGAHYDLTYPNYFGEEVLQFWENMNMIHYNAISGKWHFTDKHYLVQSSRESQAYVQGNYRYGVLRANDVSNRFLDLMDTYWGKMKLPTRLIEPDYHALNKISFWKYLHQNFTPDADLIQGIDYQMIDDFGGTSQQVSALAGVYYYGSRPYRGDETEIFSPPEGNYYFIQKMADTLPKENLWTGHLVTAIQKTNTGFEVEVLDILQKIKKKIHANQVVYAGHKHALKYTYPADKSLFQTNQYAPWLVMNLVFKDSFLKEGYWQNEFLTYYDPDWSRFLGFVDSDAQYTRKRKHRVFTAYYCFPANFRKELMTLESKAQRLVNHTVAHISDYFDLDKDTFDQAIEKVFVKVLGHAMPIPRPGYLFNDQNHYRSSPDLVYAGVDNSRLPLMLEATDSGIMAAKILRKAGKI